MFNRRWRCVKGQTFFREGEVRFPAKPADPVGHRVDGTYRTVFGPCVTHNGVIYCNCDDCMRIALRRLLCVREPDEPHKHERLCLQQGTFIDAHSHVLDELRNLYTDHFANYGRLFDEMEEHYDAPHAKRGLRINARNELHETAFFMRRLWLLSVEYKLKKDEIAKWLKRGRGIGDLGVAASLQGFRSTYLLKVAMASRPLLYKGFTIYFCKSPGYAELKWVFEQLERPPGRGFFVFFSDDSCISYNTPTGPVRINLDIKSCDASHTPALFEAAIRVAPSCAQDDVRVLVEQCALPIKVKEVRRGPGRRRTVKLRATGPSLYSGSTLTTYINGIASILIACSVADDDFITPATICIAAERAGYMVTTDICHTIEDVQFLKHSPVLDRDNVLQPVINLGVFLRASGSCHGDLPGRGNLLTRARAFQAGLFRGIYPRVHSPFLNSLRTNYGVSNDRVDKVVAKLLEYKLDVDAPVLHFTDEALFRRYRLKDGVPVLFDHQIAHFTSTFARATASHHYCDPATDAVLSKDYGLSSAGRHHLRVL